MQRMRNATRLLTIEAEEPADGDLEQSPSKQGTNLPWLVQAAAHGSQRGTHHVWYEAVQTGTESRAHDDGHGVREPGRKAARSILLVRNVER